MKNITIKSLRDKQKDKIETAKTFFKKPTDEIDEIIEKPYKPKKIKIILKSFFFIVFVLLIGGTGGILIDRIALPSLLVKYPELNHYEFLKKINERTIIIEKTEEIKISEDKAIPEAIKKVSPSVVEILEFSAGNDVPIYKGSGIILTSDGLIITSIENITTEKNDSEEKNAEANIIKIKLKTEKIYDTELVKIDLSTNLAIVRIKETDLPVIALSNSENLELGEKVIIIDSSIITDIISKFINDYDQTENNEKSTSQKRVKIINSLKNSFDGSPVINIKGEIIGISQSGNLFIPTNEIIGFIETAMNDDL
ncbi:MAG: S1C family serine protease [Patescibacteria group bacterium]|nr:S1C family serine protease [Patescibacteria group bacterium]